MEHSFNVEFAKKYGTPAAILYRNFQFWIAQNKTNGKNFRDGRTWTYMSMRSMADFHPYLSVWDVRIALKTLLDVGILLSANYNVRGYDRTTWYAFADEKTALEGLPAHLWNSQMDDAKSANGFVKSTDLYQLQQPYRRTDIKTNGVEISAQKVLELDLKIAEGKNYLFKQLQESLHPRGSREAKTFARIVRYLVEECQACRLPVSIFKDAAGWARQAASSSAENRKGLFVAKIKQETGFRAQKQILKSV